MIKDILKPFGTQGFLLGIGIAAAAQLLAPQLRGIMRPTAVKSTQGMMALGSKTKQLFNEGKERLSDFIFVKEEGTGKNIPIVAESHFEERLVKILEEERKASNQIMEEFRNTLNGLRDEISHLRDGGSFQQG